MMTRPFHRRSRLLAFALPLAAWAGLLLSAPLAAQSPPTQSERKADADRKAVDPAQPAPATASDKAKNTDAAERRKPKRDADREPLPEREREEEDGLR